MNWKKLFADSAILVCRVCREKKSNSKSNKGIIDAKHPNDTWQLDLLERPTALVLEINQLGNSTKNKYQTIGFDKGRGQK